MSILEKMFTKNTLTYIANAGVMISLKNTKIIIDGVLDKLDDKYRSPEESFIESLILSKEPYHNIDYIFTTHSHRDHLSADMANELLKRNRHVKLIGPKAVRKAIESAKNFNDVLSTQIMTISLKPHTKMDISTGDISFTAYRIPHDGTHHSTLENLAYHIYADGQSILVLGDATQRVYDYEKAGLTDKCDVLICHANMAGQKSGREIINTLKPKHLILCHIMNDEKESGRIKDLCSKHQKSLPKKVTILTEPSEVVKL